MSEIQQPIEIIDKFSIWQEVVVTPVKVCSGQRTTVNVPIPDSYYVTGPGAGGVDEKYPSVEAARSYIEYLRG